MKLLIIVFTTIILLLTSCAGTDDDSGCYPEKKEIFIDGNEGKSQARISTFEQDGKTFYVFDYGIAFDATAEVLDEDCNVVCVYGGFQLASDQDTRCAQYQDGINRATEVWSGND